jgi:DNA-binding CsgD family transcriptional regulator
MADRARILGRSGNYRAAIALATPLLNRASGRALVSACFAAATSLAAAGRTAGAIEATEHGLAVHLSLTGPPLPFGPHFHLMIRGAALNFAGWLAEAGALAGREYEKAIEEESVEAQAWFSWILAWVALNEGRAATAGSLAGESAAAFREFGWRLFVRCALMLRAHALALRGEAESARRVLEELDALGVPAEELGGPELLRARAWTAVAAGDVAEGRRHLDEAVEMARRGGGSVYESAALHDLARLGWAAEVGARLQELAAVVEGPLAPARASHAAALSARNPVELEDASVAFEELGAILLAAEAAADAAVVWRREGDPRRAAGAARRSGELAARCEGARTPSLVVGVPARALLTERELEIARLAATGLGNKEIAARLSLSRRTVENKLHAAYEKLGVSGREALRHALGSTDPPTSS